MKHRLNQVAARLALLLPAAGSCAPALSQQAAAAPTELPAIVVGARRLPELPAAGRPVAGRAATGDTASLLAEVPGVELQGAGGVSSLPVIRGLADDRHRVKVDGMDLIAACANHMNPPLSYLAPGNLGVVKVYAGITPVSVGGDSIGSTIVADSPAPQFAPAGGEPIAKGSLGAYYRSNGDARGVEAAASLAAGQLALRYHGAASEAGNSRAGGDFRTTTATGRLGHVLPRDEIGSTAYRARNHALDLATRLGADLVEAKLGYQDIPEQRWPNQRMDMLGNRQLRSNLRYRGQRDWGELEVRAWREKVEHVMDFGADKRFWYGAASGGAGAVDGTPCAPVGATCAAGMPMNTESRNTGLLAQAELSPAAGSTLRVGTEVQRYRLDDWWPPSGGGMAPNTFWNLRDGRRDRLAVFAEREAEAAAQWTTLFGARYEQVQSDAGEVAPYAAASGGQVDADRFNAQQRRRRDDNVDLTALARHTRDATLDFEFGLARKVRSPSLYERYTWRTRGMEMLMINWFGDGNGYLGRVDLAPEKAHTLSASVDWHAADRRWTLKATPYYTRVSDYIDVVRCPVSLGGACTSANQSATRGFVYLQFANQTARLYGIDLDGQLPLGAGAWGGFGLRGQLSYVRGDNRDAGDRLYNLMPLNARATLIHRLGGWDNALELVVVSAKEKVSAVRNEVRTPAYELINLRLSRAWQAVRLDLGIDNLFDRLYYHPLGGAYLGQGTTMTNAGASSPAWGVAVPGAGRSFKVAVNVGF